jgi:hypothetical protein
MFCLVLFIDIKSLNRLLKVCYAPANSLVLKAFFFLFLLQPLTALMKQTRQLVRAIKQSIYLDVYALHVTVIETCGCSLYINFEFSRQTHTQPSKGDI